MTYYACAKTGVVCVPVNLGWRAHVLRHSQARGIVIESQLVEAITPALAEAPVVADVVGLEGDRVFPVFRRPGRAGRRTYLRRPGGRQRDRAGGCRRRPGPDHLPLHEWETSEPKGVVGNHTAIYLESISLALEAKFDESDVFIAMMPMFHTAQLNCHCTAAVMVGAALHIHRSFDADRVFAEIPANGVTRLFGLPMMFRQLLDHPQIGSTDLFSLRRALYAMAPMPEARLRGWLEVFGSDFYLLFGQTEMSPTATLFRPEHQLNHNGAAGRRSKCAGVDHG